MKEKCLDGHCTPSDFRCTPRLTASSLTNLELRTVNEEGQNLPPEIVRAQNDIHRLQRVIDAFIDTCPRADHSNAEPDMSNTVFCFYKSFDDSFEELLLQTVHLQPPLEELSAASRDLIEACTSRQLTLGDAEREWELVSKLESRLPANYHFATNDFPSSASFRTYLDKMRKYTAASEGWKRAVVRAEHGVNETGVFRSCVELMKTEISACGGLGCLRPYQESVVDGVRTYSAPWDSKALEEYSSTAKRIIPVDIYCDGLTLSNSGSQSVSAVRARFPTIQGRCTLWHEVGIAPSLVTNTENMSRTAAAMAQGRSELFHRYLFIALEDLIKASSAGIMIDGTLLYPRILMVVCDQKQERAFLGLKGAGCFQECSLCDMTSRSKRVKETSNTSAKGAAKRMRTNPNDSEAESACSGEESDCLSVRHEESGSPCCASEASVLCNINDDIIRKTQTSVPNGKPRDVGRTLRCQVQVALYSLHSKKARELRKLGVKERNVDVKVTQGLSSAQKYLAMISALPFPPALAAFRGLGSSPFRLYRTVGFDKLHALDLGPLREIPDISFTVFRCNPYAHMPVSQLVAVANQRLIDLPRSTQLPKISVFKYRSADKQAGMSGSVRRAFAPFLWVAVMGLASNTTPDTDKLLQTCLYFNEVHRHLSGINMSPNMLTKTQEDIDNLQALCFEAGKMFVDTFNARVNTKLHRIMRHVSDHLLDFGCLRKGATDANETLHKLTKRAYRSTNRRLHQLASQLLNARACIPAANGDGEASEDPAAQLLLTRDPFSKTLKKNNFSPIQENLEIIEETDDLEVPQKDPLSDNEARREVDKLCDIINASTTPEKVEEIILGMRHVCTHTKKWKRRTYVRFEACFDWAPAVKVRQVLYAEKKSKDENVRLDAVQYIKASETRKGIMFALFQKRETGCIVGLVLRLEEVEPEEGNVAVVRQFGHTRYKFALSAKGHIQLECVIVSEFQHKIILVPDVYDLSKRYGVKARINEFPNTLEERILARFFEVNGFKQTSFAEKIC